ncbi:MAG: sigma-70 family RNA polymerase sigma factor [Gemmatimonadales bacterium]|nr:MAG: sigma-70 family RNA polymerase sigma factor [Gemmatimonadales bacterium]
MISTFYGHDVHMPFDRYFRLGKYRAPGRSTGAANLLQLLDPKEPKGSSIVVHGTEKEIRKTGIVFSNLEKGQPEDSKEQKTPHNNIVEEFFSAMEADLPAMEAYMEATPELVGAFEKSLKLEIDKLEGVVGIDLEAKGKHAKTLAQEVRKLLFAGFAGKMLSRGYDPEDVLQEVYRGLLVRNNGICPWDGRISTFGHYVHLVTNCVLTNYHRKEVKRMDTEPIRTLGEEGTEIDVGQYGSCQVWFGSEIGENMAFGRLQAYLEQLPEDSSEAQLARQILPLVIQGYKRGEIATEVGEQPSFVSRALAWLRREVALWATESGFGKAVPVKYLCPA